MKPINFLTFVSEKLICSVDAQLITITLNGRSIIETKFPDEITALCYSDNRLIIGQTSGKLYVCEGNLPSEGVYNHLNDGFEL